uniref:Uncharacterized protein n=1 Tax=Hippocampus comes TaxID=109280 RepID=A0A3Q2Z1P0_HIPCM
MRALQHRTTTWKSRCLFEMRSQTETKAYVCLLPQDALLQLAAVVDVRSLRVALRDVLQTLLPHTECVCVYTLEGNSRLLSDDPPHELPQEGKIRCVLFLCLFHICAARHRFAFEWLTAVH